MLTSLLILVALGQVPAQNVRPQIGYIYPPGARAGTTLEVRLGAYDWTPDMQVFVHDPRIKIELTGSASDFILTPPPYWFGAKASLAQPPLPREVPARITIPADMPPGPVRWQVANANGGSNVGTFVVSDLPEFVEPEKSLTTLELPRLPIVISGRIAKITETDTYRFQASANGLVTCRLEDRLGQSFSGILTLRDSEGKLLADAANTVGKGACATFAARANAFYTVEVRDLDFSGDRGYVYRLLIEQGPQIVATIPCVVARGKTTPVELIGWGVATGSLQMESITREVTIPLNAEGKSYPYTFETVAGNSKTTLQLSDGNDSLEPAAVELNQRAISIPTALSGVLDRLDASTQTPLDRFTFVAKKGDAVRLRVETAAFNSPVDPAIVVLSANGKELSRNDDLPGTTDAGVELTIPEDGSYELQVMDYSGLPPARSHVYRLLVEPATDNLDFELHAPDRLDIPLGGQADLIVKTVRRGVWDEPITIQLENLPPGTSLLELPAKPAVPVPAKGAKAPKKPGSGDVKLTVSAAADAAAGSQLATLVARATIDDRTIEHRFGPVLISTTIKTRCKVKSAVQDGGRIVNRGTTYPADVLIERLEGYEGPIHLQMASTQQRQRRGIRGAELQVPAGVDQVQYPVFMPEWLETSLTARMNVIGVAQVADPQGNIRSVTGIMDGFIVMSLEGALLKLSHEPAERIVKLGDTLELPLKVARSAKLLEEVRVELVPHEEHPHLAVAEPVTVHREETTVQLALRIAQDQQWVGKRSFTFRATALREGRWSTISETTVPLIIQPGNTANLP